MTKLLASRTVALSIAIAAILLGVLITFFLAAESQYANRSIISSEQYRNKSNISRGQYDAALAKWNNSHITDYEANVQVSDWGRWKIVVHVDTAYGNKFVEEVRASYSHRIVEFESLDSKAAKLDPYLYQTLTVGGLFDYASDILYCQQNSCRQREFLPPSRYLVEFDPTLGYPRSITSINKYATVETRIENVKILK